MKPIYIDDGKTRQQKNSLLLQDVRYRIYAKLIFIPVKDRPKEAFAKHQPSNDENPMKYYQMFERRALQGNALRSLIWVAANLPQIGNTLIIRIILSRLCLKTEIWALCFMIWILRGMPRNRMPCFIVLE